MSQFTQVARATAESRWGRRLALSGSVLTIFVLAGLSPLQRATETVVFCFGGTLVAVGFRRRGPGDGARVPYAHVLPWVRCFFVLCLWEVLNWFGGQHGEWRTLSDLTTPALSTWPGRFLGASLWIWSGWWLLAADSDRAQP